MMKKRILIIITTDFVPYGGLTTVMMNYYKALNKSKYSIDFASTNSDVDEGLLDELQRNGSKYYYLGDRKRHLWFYINNLRKLLRKNNYDIVHINSNSATAAIELMIAKQCKVSKRIVHNHTSECDHKRAHAILYPIFRRTYTDAIAVSKKAGEWLFPVGNYIVLNNSIDSERYRYNVIKRQTIREKYHIRENTIVLGHIGKIYKPKNHRFLISVFEAFHSMTPDSALLIVGDGEMKGEIEQLVKEKGLSDSVVFAGMQSKVEEFLSAIDVFIFPSLWEGMPLSVIEAQASGLQCIVSDAIDKDVCITNYITSMSLEQDAQEWAIRIEKLDEIDRDKTSEECIQIIKEANYDSYKNSTELEKIYDQ